MINTKVLHFFIINLLIFTSLENNFLRKFDWKSYGPEFDPTGSRKFSHSKYEMYFESQYLNLYRD